MKTSVPTVLIAGILSLSLMGTASAASIQATVKAPSTSVHETVTPRAEEKEWYYRVVNGQSQKRLWSITYNKWLTDWINM